MTQMNNCWNDDGDNYDDCDNNDDGNNNDDEVKLFSSISYIRNTGYYPKRFCNEIDLFLICDFSCFLQVSGQRLAYRFVKPLFGQGNGSTSQEVSSTKKVPTETKPTTAEEDTKQTGENSKGAGTKEVLVIPTVPCVRSIASEAPETTVSSSPMGFRIIPAPLVNPGHMTYPVYPYLVPYVIPTCRPIGIIKS